MAIAAGNLKFLHRISSFLLLRNCRRTLITLHLPSQAAFSNISLLQTVSHRPLSSSPVFFCTASAYAGDVAEAPPPPVIHPWHEWEEFLEKLRGKGYLDQASLAEASATGKAPGGSLDSSKYYSRVKIACLEFARERPDILGSLSKPHIKVVVDCGCPNLLRKSVNSAKRLRAYLNINEADVCSTCNLRDTCDRANVEANSDEGARTVDIVRLLLQYAAAESSENNEEGPGITDSVKESARKLLLELVKLSDTKPDPDVLKAMTLQPKADKPPRISKLEASQIQNVEMKRGDWICTQCNFMNYARNLKCLRCKGDGPKRVELDRTEMKKGDWTCPQCQFMNFAKNLTCRRCSEARPKPQLNPGEWECPSCNFVNFRRNRSCLKCNCDRPKDEVSNQFVDDEWRRPKPAT